MSEHNKTGKDGETFAYEYLIKKGYLILEKNWRFKHLEVDIIALIHQTLVIVEVKSRSSNAFGEPEDFVSIQKQKNLVKATNAYIIEKNLNYETRFDVISVIHNSKETHINHLIDAFYPTLK